MNILEFPIVLLLEIFSYIDKWTMLASVSKVCHTFHRLSFDRSLWTTVSMDQFPRTEFTTKSFHELLSGVQNSVRCLHLDMEQLDDIGMLHDGITCSNLKELQINVPFVATGGTCANYCHSLEQLIEQSKEWEHIISLKKYISSFGERYPKLKALVIQSGGLNVGFLSDMFLDLETLSIVEGIFQDSCREFFKNHPSIRHLSLNSCRIEPSVVLIVLSQLPKLETLDLSCTKDRYVDCDTEANVVKYDQLCRLRELCIDYTDNEFLSHICNKMPELRKLYIERSGFKDKELIEIAKHCPKLETLRINYHLTKCSTITNDGLCAIAASCKKLQVLHANYCSEVNNIGIQRIIESCPNLRELEIAECITLTDADMFSLVDNCPTIQKLNLRECTGLTSKSIVAILVGCKSLTNLDLQDCNNLVDIRITDDSTPNIAATGEDSANKTVETDKLEKEMFKLDVHIKDYQQPIKAHSHVRTLYLQSCVNLSDKCLEQISRFCTDLRDVDLNCCSGITNEGVTTLVQNCTLLEKLNLSSISRRLVDNPSKLSRECLSSIAKYCKNLRVLIMMTHIPITADGIFDVIQNCPRIEHIHPSTGIIFKLKLLLGKVSGKIIYTKESPHYYVSGKIVRVTENPHYHYDFELNIYIYRDYSEQS